MYEIGSQVSAWPMIRPRAQPCVLPGDIPSDQLDSSQHGWSKAITSSLAPHGFWFGLGDRDDDRGALVRLLRDTDGIWRGCPPCSDFQPFFRISRATANIFLTNRDAHSGANSSLLSHTFQSAYAFSWLRAFFLQTAVTRLLH